MSGIVSTPRSIARFEHGAGSHATANVLTAAADEIERLEGTVSSGADDSVLAAVFRSVLAGEMYLDLALVYGGRWSLLIDGTITVDQAEAEVLRRHMAKADGGDL